MKKPSKWQCGLSENCNIEEWVQAAKDKLHSSRLDCQDQLSNSYLSVLHCGDYGASRILELCESDDLKVRDTATFLLCKLSGKDFFRCKFRAGGVSILMTKIDIYPKNSRIWKNLVHALAFYTRNNVISQTDQNMLIVLYNAMTDLTLSDEFRNFILNAFLQLQFSEDSLNTLYKLGLHNSLLQIIENYAIENEFDGCFTVKPKSEVTETVAEESESGEEYDSDLSKKKKQFSISSPSFLAIEEEVRSRREKSPGVYNVFGIPVSPSHEVAPDGSSSPTGYISRPGCSYYSPPSSPCSSLPLSPSCDVFQSYDYASEPESKEESSVVDREVERKRIKRDESILNLDKLIRQSQESLKSSKITVDDSISAPLDWSLSLLNNIHWRVGKTDLKNDLKALKVLTTYIDAVKQPSLRCCSVLRRITSKTSRLSQIISEGFVTHLGKLKFQCNCDRHSNRNQIAEEALKSISAAAATPYGFHQMKSLLESDFSNVAVSLPYLKIDDREMLYLFDQTFPKLINIKDNTSVISAIREYGRRFFPVHDSIVKAKKKAHLSCCVDETNVYFVTDSGEKIGAKREQINSKFEAMLKFHATSEIPWKDTDARLVKYLVHYVSGCRKTIHKCCALKGLKLTDKGKLLHLGRSYFVDDLVSDIMFDLVSSEVTPENVAELYVNIFSCDIGDFESEKVIFLRKIVDSNDLDLMRTMLNSNLSEHFLGVIRDAVHERFERFIGK
ncbi:uncharacterized protein LOC136028086 isoform X3 [Artemia franciscana]|uniref:uncharacterized protein LOC136028086 isoform X3 n=1 Tax=Artemia franciscana TaxID=6661 RepID=UPI0032DA4CFD